MRKIAIAVASAAVGLAAAPGTASAQTCVSGSTQDTCQRLVECYAVGAAIFLSASREQAVRWSHRCLRLDRRYRLHQHSSGEHAHRRAHRLRVRRSTFWSLYCRAAKLAGNPTPRICRVE